MDVGTSKGLESFLAFLRETTERHRMAEADREELLKLTTPELASAAQALGAAVHLRQQMEIAEFTRGLIEQQKAAQEPQGGPLPC